ncbi:hypothetical protein [Sphingomonas bacterium]|uniref:hypothetical protein n=1 Tax=Sphingomonas bacterium TaxID=1895847 RepID=UPI001C2D0566|nr:hypothetical protein [Sphingomonas bacterium]
MSGGRQREDFADGVLPVLRSVCLIGLVLTVAVVATLMLEGGHVFFVVMSVAAGLFWLLGHGRKDRRVAERQASERFSGSEE